ncbi:hypothetical protein P153DRAFT_380911 [Dothidotthia symphoricarpi CBS 119687]|uniref:Uncharacterized protein n=1 Tax=Dothidotthia symphoricarpi CBS 119687 TaxID=1392245 RepID=A0A6A6AR83_9PLEO|nr:uncharacterized protein P153DRAFT_380911 [Dothidotthia symphoricarpi CBS 119687]KAF2133723.1 hypothetical protein P153DRAFT_380911 [Dothidotthia symphoricarpi CBS 119687]
MIFGGLEIVAGGYLVHRHYRKKDEKKKFQEEVQARRHSTFPGANPYCAPQAQQLPQPYQLPIIPQQKYACYGVAAPRPQPQTQPQYQAQPQVQPQFQPRPQPTHTQSFTIPRRPVPQQKPPIFIIQPPLRRTDSFATISRMPIADGSRPHDVSAEHIPVLPTRPYAAGLSPVSQSPYGNVGFSVSTPALGATPTSPSATYVIGAGHDSEGRYTVDDNWETYEHGHRYAETDASTELGERDPPPPYAP